MTQIDNFKAMEYISFSGACEARLSKSLQDLGLEYFDLYLMHFPISLKYVPFETRYPPEWIHDPNAVNPRIELDSIPLSHTWRAMEDLVSEGYVRNIGTANLVVSNST